MLVVFRISGNSFPGSAHAQNVFDSSKVLTRGGESLVKFPSSILCCILSSRAPSQVGKTCSEKAGLP